MPHPRFASPTLSPGQAAARTYFRAVEPIIARTQPDLVAQVMTRAHAVHAQHAAVLMLV